jgi:hypothetical protein
MVGDRSAALRPVANAAAMPSCQPAMQDHLLGRVRIKCAMHSRAELHEGTAAGMLGQGKRDPLHQRDPERILPRSPRQVAHHRLERRGR